MIPIIAICSAILKWELEIEHIEKYHLFTNSLISTKKLDIRNRADKENIVPTSFFSQNVLNEWYGIGEIQNKCV